MALSNTSPEISRQSSVQPTTPTAQAFTEAAALRWLAEQDGGRVEISKSALALEWGWARTTLRRRLKSWSEHGMVTVAAAAHGRMAISLGQGNGHGRPAAAVNGHAGLATATGQIDPVVAGRDAVATGPGQIAPILAMPTEEPAAASLPPQIRSAATLTSHKGSVGDNTDAIIPPDAATITSLPGERGLVLSNIIAYLAAMSLAGVSAYFSVGGMAEMFPGFAAAVMVLAATMEATKLVAVGWLARHWLSTGLVLRAVLIVPVTSFAVINAAGLYGRLVEAHVGVTVAVTSSIDERLGVLDAKLDAQTRTVAGFDQRLGEIDAAIGKMTERGRPGAALDAMASQRKAREGLIADRLREESLLVGLRSDRAKLDAERQRAAAANGPVVYLAATLGVPVELAIRWLILMMALTCDPATIALTVAASRPKYPGTDQVRVRLQEHDVFRPAGCLECSEEIECRRSAGEPLEARNGAPDAGWGHLR